MDLKKSMVVVVLIALSFCTFSILSAQNRRSSNVNVRTGSGQPVTDCRDIQVEFDRQPGISGEDVRTISRRDIPSLEVRAPRSGGVYVSGWTGDEYVVKTCKAASAEAGPGVLNRISTSIVAGRVSIDGPAGDDWVAYVLVQAPRESVLNLEASNGPISLFGVSGRMRAHAVNGPISLQNIEGEADIQTQNGPISFEGGKGKLQLVATNGPIHVELTGNRWDGAGLEARTQNGPLTLELPENYSSGVRVDVSAHSPVKCAVPQCRQAIRTWAEPDRIEFGAGNPLVRLTTVNGPVTIGSR